ncbi:MAG: YggT family protein [Coriobacteriia bacterium]|nr:YggT family protein [Coriobacteriia bacterium]
MHSVSRGSTDHRSQVHTEVRAPAEAVISRVVWFIFGFIEILIAIRFVLKMFGANSAAGFAKLVYGVSDILMAPFSTLFSTQRVEGAVFEWSALVAIAIYALIAWGIVALIRAVVPREHAQTVERVETDQDVNTPRG